MPAFQPPSPSVAAQGLLALLEEDEPELQEHALEQLYTYVVVRSDFPAHAAATRPGSSCEEEAFLHGLVFVEVDIQCLDVLVREL